SVHRAGWWLRSSAPESKLVLHPAPARSSLAVGLFGVRTGEHAHGTADAAHIPLGPGSKTVPVSFSGQSRPNLIYEASIERRGYFPDTWALPDSDFERALEIRRGLRRIVGARRPTASTCCGPELLTNYSAPGQ